MTKSELINNISKEAAELSKKDISNIVDEVFNLVNQSIADTGKFSYPGFGTFEVRHRKERQGINPRTKETINIAASNTVGFRPAKNLKESVNS